MPGPCGRMMAIQLLAGRVGDIIYLFKAGEHQAYIFLYGFYIPEFTDGFQHIMIYIHRVAGVYYYGAVFR